MKALIIALCIYLLPSLTNASYIGQLDNDPFQDNDFLKDPEVSRQMSKLPPVLSPDQLTDATRSIPRDMDKVPQYIVDGCPVVHLYSEERYWPSDIIDYVQHFHLEDASGHKLRFKGGRTNITSLEDIHEYYTDHLKNGNTTADIPSGDLFMTSDEDFASDPAWLVGHRPEYGTGYIKRGPAVLLVADKGNGWVDAYWFYFYPFNWGPYIMGYGPWGNHLGDWEHSLVRFYNGEPKYLWMSAHSGGTAYQYEAIEKTKKLRRVGGKPQNEVIERPLIFSARGTHANYASVGQYSHDVPFFFMPLSDFTDRGPMWDPVLNYYAYQLHTGEDSQTPRPLDARSREIGAQWLMFAGKWGDKQLPGDDPRQKWCPVQWRYIDGPLGPLFKNLERTSLCPSFKAWNVWHGCPPRRWIKKGEGLDAERNDLVGDNCGVLLYSVRPKWLRGLLRLLMWRGTICFFMDYFTG